MDRARLRVKPGHAVSLRDFDPSYTGGFDGKKDATAKLAADIETLVGLESILGSQTKAGVLILIQGMDTAGKDGVIKHVMSGLNPQGVSVYAFKEPSQEELHHDFLWRCMKVVPPRGRIGIFNRSYYEDVLVVRVHPELLPDLERKPDAAFWRHRLDDIAAYERYLTRNGIVVLKFFLHVSKEEQAKRLLDRLRDPDKQWKFSVSDVRQRAFWDDYVAAYEQLLGATSTSWAPWYVIPADHKWFARVAVADIVVHALKRLGLHYPKLSKDARADLARLRRTIER